MTAYGRACKASRGKKTVDWIDLTFGMGVTVSHGDIVLDGQPNRCPLVRGT